MDVAVEIKDSFLTYMESAEIRKQAELKEHCRHNMVIERLEQDRINM